VPHAKGDTASEFDVYGSPHPPVRSVNESASKGRRWFKQGQKWRTGCEGRISVLKRWVGLGVPA
jgi:hypothetical protein